MRDFKLDLGRHWNRRRSSYIFFILTVFFPIACGGGGAAVTGTAVVTTISGTPTISGFVDGPGGFAQFFAPEGITTSGANLYVADTYNHTIRQVVKATGAVTTMAGSAGIAGSKDGTGTAATFNYPYGIAADGTYIYISDSSNHTIRKMVMSTGVVTTLAGSTGLPGSTDGIGTAAKFNYPRGLAYYGGILYVADGNNNLIRQVVVSTGAVSTVAGSPGGGSADGKGTSAGFLFPYDVATDGANLYVTDTVNSTIRQITLSNGMVSTIAGTPGVVSYYNGVGTGAQFNHPRGLAVQGGSVYVVDTGNNAIRQIVLSTGVVTTLAGGGAGAMDGTGTGAGFLYPYAITADGNNFYVADTNNDSIRQIH